MPVSPPRPKGPHLTALRAFEAAARLGSFSAAAEELGVTPGAITQQVKSLEGWAGAALFHRNARGIVPTALTCDLLPGFSAAFDQLGVAVHGLRQQADPRHMSIATQPAVAQLWLPARLARLRALAPEVEVSVTALETFPNLAREQFDLALFFADHPTPAGDIALPGDQITPVCAPALAARLARPDDLLSLPLLHDATWSGDWALWFAAAGLGPAPLGRGRTYSLFAVALEEARRGAGVLISPLSLVETALASGDLVRPFAITASPARRLVLRMTPGLAQRPVFASLKQALTRP